MTRKKRRIPSQGIQGTIAGMTVMVKGVEVVMLPRLAKIFAVKFCGAAAGVASTISCVFVCGCCIWVHWGRKVRVNPESGKPCSPKQASPEMPTLVRVRLIVALSPTLITAADGLSDKLSWEPVA